MRLEETLPGKRGNGVGERSENRRVAKQPGNWDLGRETALESGERGRKTSRQSVNLDPVYG